MVDRHWPEALAVVVAAALFATLPGDLVPGPPAVQYVVAAVEVVLGGFLIAGNRRRAALGLIGVVGATNAAALGYLIHQLVYTGGVTGRTLLYAAFDVWVTNAIAFALLYWELDGESPDEPDFLFPQMSDEELGRGWHPRFVDYLFTSYTNGTAFSPTDTLPLTPRAKMLMLLQSAVSITTLLLVAARAVNILR
jgi:uncharacterized membrane protein